MFVSNQRRLRSYVSERRLEEPNADNQQERLDRLLEEKRGVDLQASKYADLASRIGARLSQPGMNPGLGVLFTAVKSQKLDQLLKRYSLATPLGKFGEQLQANLQNPQFKQEFNTRLSTYVEAKPEATTAEVANHVATLLGGAGNEAEVMRELEQLRAEVSKLSSENTALKTENQELSEENNELDSANEALVRRIVEYKQNLSRLESEQEELVKKLQRLTTDREAAKRTYGEQYKTYKNIILQLQTDNARLTGENQALVASLRRTVNDANGVINDQTELLERLEQAQRDNDRMRVTLEQASRKITALESAVQEQANEKKQALQELRRAQAEVIQAIEESKQAQIQQQRESQRELNAQQAQAKRLIESIRKDAEKQIADAALQMRSTADAEIGKLNDELRDTRDNLAAAQEVTRTFQALADLLVF